jgi:thiamine transport system substrate-binding protein
MQRFGMRFFVLMLLLSVVVACGQRATSGTGSTPLPEMTSIEPTESGDTEATTTSPPVAPEAASTSEAETTTAGEQAIGTTTPDYGRILTIMTHDSFNASADVIAEFEQANKVNLRFLKSGDAGSLVNRAILSKGNPLADVLFGIDNTFFSRAITADIFEPYKPAGLDQIPSDLNLDPENRLTPIDYGFVNFNYEKAAFGDGKLPLPSNLRDLTKPEYKGKIVVPSPTTSSPGLAFLLATVAAFGTDGDYPWTQFWTDLRANDVVVVDSWDTAYYTNFSGSSGKGAQPLVLSYATSPPAEVIFSEGKYTEPPTANLLMPNAAFRQIEFAGILKGTANQELAQRWIDYMITTRFQEDIPLQMFVYPVNPDAALPKEFEQWAPVPSEPAMMPADEIAQNRDAWLQEWARIMQQ